jgi:hypothetical protein
MTQTNLTIEKLNSITQKSGFTKSCKAYSLIKSAIENGNPKIWPVQSSGRGRFTKNLDYTNDVKKALNKMGVAFTEGNDAPRGGKTGTFIMIS